MSDQQTPTSGQPYPPANSTDAQGGVVPRSAGGARNGMAIAAMVLGVVGIVLSFLIAFLGIILGIIALVLAIVARRRGESVPGHGRGLIIAGIVLGALSIVVGIVNIVLAAVLLSQS